MNEIARTPEMIAVEINSIKDQTRRMVLNNSIEIGRRLAEAKEIVPHGSWAEWCENSVDYSQRTVSNLIKVFEEYGSDQLSLFGGEVNSQALANLGYSQAVALLGVSKNEREAFVEENDVKNKSTRELQKLVKSYQKKAAAAEIDKDEAEKQLADAEEATRKMRIEILQQEKEIENIKTLKAEHAKETDRLQAKLEKAKENGNSPEMVSKLERDLASQKAKVKELEEELKNPPKIEPAIREVVPEEIKTELAQLRLKAAADESPAMVKFRLMFETFTKDYSALLEQLGEIKSVDAAVYTKCAGAIHKAVNQMAVRLGGEQSA